MFNSSVFSRPIFTLLCLVGLVTFCYGFEEDGGSVWEYRDGQYIKLGGRRQSQTQLKSLSPPPSPTPVLASPSAIRYYSSFSPYNNQMPNRYWWWQRCGVCPYGYVRRWSVHDVDVECGQCKPVVVPPPPAPPRCAPGYSLVEGICTRTPPTCRPGFVFVGGRCQLSHSWEIPARQYCPGCYCTGYDCPCDDCHHQLDVQEERYWTRSQG